MPILNLGEHIVEIAVGHSIILIDTAAYEQETFLISLVGIEMSVNPLHHQVAAGWSISIC